MGQVGQSRGTTLAPSHLQSFLVYHCNYLVYCQHHAHCPHSTSATHSVQVSGWGHGRSDFHSGLEVIIMLAVALYPTGCACGVKQAAAAQPAPEL